ncbi:MAG: hypothetical protein ACLTNO_08200 [Blautia sp.]
MKPLWSACGKNDEGLEDLVLKLYDFAMSNPWPQEWLRQCVLPYQAKSWEEVCQSPWMEQVWQHGRKILTDLKSQVEETLGITQSADGPHMYQPMVESDLALVEEL